MNILGAEKIIYHADRLVDIKRDGDTYPVHMVVGVTDYCCHKCIFCNTEFVTADHTRVHTINKDVLLKFLQQAQNAGLKAVTICGSGEPLIHPEIESILYGIHEMGLEIGIFTNASNMNDSIRQAILDTCTFVRCSVNASNAHEHEIVHQVKGEFPKIVNNITNLVEEKKKMNKQFPTIGVQFVFYQENYLSIVAATKLWKKIGVDYFEVKPLIEGEGSAVGVKVFPAKDVKAVGEQMAIAKTEESGNYQVFTKYGQYLNTLSEEQRNYKICYGHALDPNLWSDGNMYICSNQEHEKDIIGNIYENSFMEIWHGEKRKRRIEQIQVNSCPRGCRCDPINQKIWDYLYPNELVHPNFI